MHPFRSQPDGLYDVAILGTGIAATILASILQRNGARVILVDASAPPRFAIGESTIPFTLVTLRVLAERYGIPEIKDFATFTNINRRIGNSFGVKKHFGFLLHHDGREQDPRQVNQYGTPGLLHESSHLFRQDVDSYLFHVALRYGCDAALGFSVRDIDIADDRVVLTSSDEQSITCKYLVDGTGFRSVVADKLGLRETPCRFRHHSRALFTHMVNVLDTDDVLAGHGPEDVPPDPWFKGTVHHLFERGWFWVIPFSNHEISRNPLVSVGLTMDPRTYPRDSSLDPEEEFFAHAARFPAVARQFAGARAIREWVSTDRLQYSSHTCVGDRWCLLSHAAGFLDPLFSRGLSNTAEVINALAWRLLCAVKDGDFSARRFAYVDRLQQALFDFNDGLVNSSFISFSDYDLWNAVFRIWSYGSNMGTFRQQNALTAFLASGDESVFHALEDAPHLGLAWPDHDGYAQLYATMCEQCEAVAAGVTTSKDAARVLWSMIEAADWIPPKNSIAFANCHDRYLSPNPLKLMRLGRWAAISAPRDVRALMTGTLTAAVRAAAAGKRLF
jgi:tetracycline 7-halogenase / FADH2 O2-dependent halogenase